MNGSDLFPAPKDPLPSGWVKDPRLLPIHDAGVALGASMGGPNAANFWSANFGIASVGAALATAAANVYGTICDLSGRGLLFHVIPPKHNAGATVSWRITVDGEVYEIVRAGPWRSVNQTGRAVMGGVTHSLSSEYTSAGAQTEHFGADGSYAAKDRVRSAVSSPTLIQPWKLLRMSHPILYFEESLKVETKSSFIEASNTTYDWYSGATYMMLG